MDRPLTDEELMSGLDTQRDYAEDHPDDRVAWAVLRMMEGELRERNYSVTRTPYPPENA
jgi:hypothetical protein